MSATFKSLSNLLENVEATRKRLEIIEQTANYLNTLRALDIQTAVNLLIGRAFPAYSQKTLDVSWVTLRHVLERVSAFDWSLFQASMAKTGDLGSSVKAVLEQTKTRRQTQLTPQPLTIAEVQRALDSIAQTRGTRARAKKEQQIIALFSQASPNEAKYLVKILTGEMRTGLHEGLMEQAVAQAFGVPLDKVQHAVMVLGDVGELAMKLKTEGAKGLAGVEFRVFRPVKLMLAQTADSVTQSLAEQGGEAAFEFKYDGARVQIHLQGAKVRIFSRRLSDVTESLPEVAAAAKAHLKADSAIVEGEVVAFDSAGFPIAFQHLMRRFKRIQQVSGMAEKIPLTIILFDILFLNGESLITQPYRQRREILCQVAGSLQLSRLIQTDQPQIAEAFLKEALAAGYEGLMAKKPNSPYMPGRRGKRWLKIKPVLEPLDLVITAAEYGYGRRRGWLSDYTLGARDPVSGGFFDVGKTFKGLTDGEIIELTQRLKQLAISEKGHRMVVLPQIVAEVVYNEIQQSPKYRSGMALRFARITRVRDDKSPEEASTIEQVREIYTNQFRTKGKSPELEDNK